jgi:YjbE family integral membrane protein
MIDSLLGSLTGHELFGPVSVFFQVLMIDLVLAGDNAVAVGLAAGGLPSKDRTRVIVFGLAAAVVMRIGFALVTTQLLGIIGLLLAGGILLLWVCWKMWRDLRGSHGVSTAGGAVEIREAKSFGQAFLQILIADLSMSLDNVLAVAGAAREHPMILAIGLLLSIILMGVAANWIATMLNRHRWIGYVGLGIVLYVALHMVWQGHRTTIIDLNMVKQYNAMAPGWAEIGPREAARHKGGG